MNAKNTTVKSTAVDMAKKHVADVEKSIKDLAADIKPLREEREKLSQKLLLSPEDVDRLADLEEGTLPRRERHLEKLQSETLPDALAALRREELLVLAGEGVESIPGKREALDQTVAEAEQTIADALAEIREASSEWNSFVSPILTTAQEAGQDDRDPVDPSHPVTVKLDSLGRVGRERPLYVTIDGTDYRPADADGVVRGVASRGDKHLAELIRLGVEEQIDSEVRRGRWAR